MSDEMYEGSEDYYEESAGWEDGGDEGYVETEEPAEAEAQEDDPWDFLKGYKPEQIRPTVEKFTQAWEEELKKREELTARERELEPFKKLKDELETNPDLFNVINDYMESGRAPEAYIQELRQELDGLKAQISIERELNELHKEIASRGLPDFDDETLVKHALKIGAPIDVAYRDMNFETAAKTAEEKVVKDIKRSRGVTPPKSAGGSGDVRRTPTVDEIANMSKDEFMSHYDELRKRISPSGGRRPSL